MRKLKVMKIKLYLFICLMGWLIGAQAQRQCGTHAYHERMMQEDASYRNARLAIEEFSKTTAARSFKAEASNKIAVTIPVVVHVLYNKFEDSLSDAQILSQIEVLNNDFQLLNEEVNSIPDEFAKVASPVNVRFELARRKPDGSITNGIVRKFTSKISFTDNNDMKFSLRGGDNAWDATQYLNIWVCRLSSNLLGYAQLPGGAAASDGVVISTLAFGTMGTAKHPYNKGRSTTHEVGHWLNLKHIWGDKSNCEGDDLVDDTPTQSNPTYGLPQIQPQSCGHNTMYMNFMDYTDDAGMAMFTAGQAARMESLFEPGGFRYSLLSSEALLLGKGETAEEEVDIITCNTELNDNNLRSKAKLIKHTIVNYGKIDQVGKSEWYSFSNNKVQNNIYITLTDLTEDLDMALYDDKGLLLTRSRRSGDKSEAIAWNDAVPGTYYLRVYGYKGATSTNCYALQTQVSKIAFKTDDNEEIEIPKPEDIKVLESRLYPNPTTNAANFDVNLEEAGNVSIDLFDIRGAKVKSFEFSTVSGFRSLNIEMNDLQAGIYNLIARSGDASFRQRLVLSR